MKAKSAKEKQNKKHLNEKAGDFLEYERYGIGCVYRIAPTRLFRAIRFIAQSIDKLKKDKR